MREPGGTAEVVVCLLRLAIVLIPELPGMLGAHDRHESQLARDAYHFYGDVGTVRPVADVLGYRFFAIVDGESNRNLGH